jgi:branched-chain amino acid transport system permease protein
MIPPILVETLAYASAIALFGCSINLLYISTRTFNFAHANMATWGFYIAFTCTALWGRTPYLYFPLSLLFGAFLGVLFYLTINRPLLRLKASETTLMMSTMGYDIMLLGTIQIFCDYLSRILKIRARIASLSAYDFEIGRVRAAGILLPIIAIGIILLIHLFLRKTKVGTAMRATIENPELAAFNGINCDAIYLISWLLGGGLASLGGSILGMSVTGTPIIGMKAVASMFAAGIFGGLYSFYAGALGGFAIGIFEYTGSYALATLLGSWILPYRFMIPLIIMAITLLFFPRGLMGMPWSRVVMMFRVGGREG